MAPLEVIGIFMLGAAAGSLLSYVLHRSVLQHYRESFERAIGQDMGLKESSSDH